MHRLVKRLLTYGACAALGLAVAGIPGCVLEEHVCPLYACINGARLSGNVAVPEGTSSVQVEYCSPTECVQGTLQLEPAGSPAACTGSGQPQYSDGICVSRSADGTLAVDAFLTRQDDGTLPPDGERYRLSIVDANSGETLVDETREADYETTRRDECHWCWSAEMRL